MLTSMRKAAETWLIKGLLFMIVITFVSAYGYNFLFDQKSVLVKVGNVEIMVNEFQRRYQKEMERYRERFGENADLVAAQSNLREQIYNGMVARQLMLQEAARRGVIVTSEEVRKVVLENPGFQSNGRFDFAVYQQVLENNQLNPGLYEKLVEEDLLVARQQQGFLTGLIVGKPQVEERYHLENERVEVEYFQVDPARFTNVTAPDEAALKTHYEKNPNAYMQAEQYNLSYFILTLPDMEKGAEVNERAIQRYYERAVETEFTTPKRVRASHILKRVPQDATPEVQEKARKAMEGVLAEAKAGKDFAALARQHSEDFSKDKGGDLGFFKSEEMLPPFSAAAFSLKKGEISGLVRTNFGFHIIKVADIENEVRQPLDAVRAEIERKLKSERGERRMEVELQRMPSRIATEGLDAVAASFGKTKEETGLFDNLTVHRQLGSLRTLHSQLKSKKKSEAGVWKRNPLQGHVFYQLKEKKESLLKPLNEVRREITEQVLEERRREAAMAEARKVFPELKTAADFADYAKKKGFQVKTVSFTAVDRSIEGVGSNHEFQRTAFALAAEKPIGVSIKDNQAHLLRFKRRFIADADKSETKKTEINQQIENELGQYILDREIQRLKQKSDVKLLTPEILESPLPSPAPRRS